MVTMCWNMRLQLLVLALCFTVKNQVSAKSGSKPPQDGPVCPPGCKLQGTVCKCPNPKGNHSMKTHSHANAGRDAQVHSGPKSPHGLVCRPNCKLQGNICKCPHPKGNHSMKSHSHASAGRNAQVPSVPQYVCHFGCVLVDGMCTCIGPALQLPPPPGQSTPTKSICPKDCSVQGQSCVCVSFPREVLEYSPTALICPQGCPLQNGMCSCLYPALQVPDQRKPYYICSMECILQDQSCICIHLPKERLDDPAEYECQSGCVLQGDLCLCTFNPLKQTDPQDPSKTNYICATDCFLNGESCICLSSAKRRPKNPTGLTHYICRLGCKLQGQFCFCFSPPQIQPGTNPPSFGCDAGCALQRTVCECITPATKVVDNPVGPNTHLICGPNCVLQGTVCTCIYTADLVIDSNGEPEYSCKTGCSLRNVFCFCTTIPEQVTDPPKHVPQVQPTSGCKQGCIRQDNACVCFSTPNKIVGRKGTRYTCESKCTLVENTCYCVEPLEKEPTCPALPKGKELVALCKKILPSSKDCNNCEEGPGDGKLHIAAGCDGEIVKLQCPMFHYIETYSVFWGRSRKYKCDGSKSGRCEDDSGDALLGVIQQCEFWNTCKLHVTKDLLGDGCSDVTRMVVVKYKCLRNTKKVHDDFVCAGDSLLLKCRHRKIVRLNYVVYGRDMYGTGICQKGSVTKINCRADNSDEKMAALCQNKNGCTELAKCYRFKNVCPTTDRYLRAIYFCVPNIPLYQGGPLTRKEEEMYRARGNNLGGRRKRRKHTGDDSGSDSGDDSGNETGSDSGDDSKDSEDDSKDSGNDSKDSGDDSKDSGNDSKDSGDDSKDSGDDSKDSGDDSKDSGDDSKDSGDDSKDDSDDD